MRVKLVFNNFAHLGVEKPFVEALGFAVKSSGQEGVSILSFYGFESPHGVN